MTTNRPIKKLWEIYPEIKIWWTPSREKKEYFWWWLPWVSIRDMSDNKYITETKETLSELWVKNSNVKLIKKWALLFSFKLTVWRMAFAWYDLYTNEAIASFEPNKNIDLNYLYYILPYVAHQVDRTNNYWAPLLNKSVIASLKIPLPPLPTQQLIVAKLDETFAQIDEAIATTQANIDQTDELTKSVLDKVFEEGEWEKVKMGEVFIIERGWSPRPIDQFLTKESTWINWIKIWDTKNIVKYIHKTEEKIKPEWVKRSRMVYEWDFILSNSMSFWRPYIMKTTGCIHDWRLVIRPNELVDNNFLYHLLSSPFMYAKFEATAAGTWVKNLNIQKVKEILIPLPPLAKQQEIVDRLDQVFAETKQLKSEYEARLQQLKELKASVLQSAFNPNEEEQTKQ